jgi:hypothetical protein
VLRDSARGRVKVAGTTDAPIPWPYSAARGGKRQLVLCGDLARAVRTESAEAVAYHWGITRWTVRDWRRALGVGRATEGTRRRMAALVETHLAPEALARGGQGRAGTKNGGAAPPPVHLTAPGPGGPLTPARSRDRKALARLGWEQPVEPGDYARLLRAALGAGITLVLRRPAPSVTVRDTKPTPS